MEGNLSLAVTSASNATPAADIANAGLCGGDELMVFRFVCEVAISLPVAIFGVLGNTLAFAVLCWHEQKGATNILLRCLAVADTFTLVFAIVLRSLRYWHVCLGGLDAYSSVYGYIFCWLYPAVYFIRLFNVCVTVLLTVERYIAVSHPFRAQQWCTVGLTYKYIVVVGIFSFAFSVIRFFEYEVSPGDPSQFDYTRLLQNRVYTILYRIIMFFLIMYLIPMAMLIVLNAGLWRALKKAILRRTSMQRAAGRDAVRSSPSVTSRNSTRAAGVTSKSGSSGGGGCSGGGCSGGGGGGSSHSGNPSASITVMVLVVVLVCIICNVTAMVSHLLWSLNECFEHLGFLELYRRYLANISNVLVNINSAVNFAIYCLCSRSFRDSLRKMFFGCSRSCRCECTTRTHRGLLLMTEKLWGKHVSSYEMEVCGNGLSNGHKLTSVLYRDGSERTFDTSM